MNRAIHHFLFAAIASISILSNAALSQEQIPISIENRSDFHRVGEWVEFGVPLPVDWNATDLSVLSLKDGSGQAISAQFHVLSRWGAGADDESAPVKWALAGTHASVNASSTREYYIDRSAANPTDGPTLIIDDSTEGTLLVDTQAALFEIDASQDFNIIAQATIDGQPLLSALTPRQAIHYEPDGTSSIVGSNPLDLTPRTTLVTVERSGALSAVIKEEGSVLNEASEAVLDFTARLHFFAGSASVRIDFTLENNHPIIEGEWGQPSNAYDQGAPNSVYIGNLSLNWRLNRGDGDCTILGENGLSASLSEDSVRLYQDSSGADFWDAYVGSVGWPGMEAVAHPRLQSYCERRGYTISGAPLANTIEGNQSQGWLSLIGGESESPRLTASVRDFWQNFPKAIEANADGTLSVHLFPNGSQFHHNFRVGEEKTHTVFLNFGLGAISREEAERAAIACARPLVAVVAPDWILKSGVLPEVPPVNAEQWPQYEDYVRVAFEPSHIYDPNVDDSNFGNSTLRETVERYNFYGWQDYGDFPIDYEAFGENQAGQINLKYWYLYALFVQYCRSGDLNWYDLARPAAWHMADVDHLHIPDGGIQHWAHGAYFGHSQHDEPGNINPNRNSNSPSVDLVFGVPGLLMGYYLTGEQRFVDTALEAVQSYESMSEFAEFENFVDWESVIQRGQANLIFAYTEIYKLTGDERWLNRLNGVIQPLADLSNKEWLTNPSAYGAEHPAFYIRLFMFNQVLWTMGRYLDFLHEFNRPDAFQVADAMRAYGDFVINFVMQEYPAGSGRAVHPYDFVFDGSDPSYLDVNNWALVMADALAYVYKYTGESRFLDAAERFYRTGVTDSVFEDDPPVYMAAKDLVNALNWGLVFMNQTNLETSIARRDWMAY